MARKRNDGIDPDLLDESMSEEDDVGTGGIEPPGFNPAEAAQQADEDEETDEGDEDELSWLPEKFRKDPTKLVEAYTNLEREFGETREYNRRLETRLEQIEQQMRQPQPSADVYERQVEQLYEMYENDPIRATQYMIASGNQALLGQITQMMQANQPDPNQVTPQDEMTAYVADVYMDRMVPDWSDYKERVHQRILRQPNLLPDHALGSIQGISEALHVVYELEKAAEAQDLLAEYEKNGITEDTLARARKLRAQTTRPSRATRQEMSPQDIELAEMKDALERTSWSARMARYGH